MNQFRRTKLETTARCTNVRLLTKKEPRIVRKLQCTGCRRSRSLRRVAKRGSAPPTNMHHQTSDTMTLSMSTDSPVVKMTPTNKPWRTPRRLIRFLAVSIKSTAASWSWSKTCSSFLINLTWGIKPCWDLPRVCHRREWGMAIMIGSIISTACQLQRVRRMLTTQSHFWLTYWISRVLCLGTGLVSKTSPFSIKMTPKSSTTRKTWSIRRARAI